MPPKNTEAYRLKVCMRSSSVPDPKGMGTVMLYTMRLAAEQPMKNTVIPLMIQASYRSAVPTSDICPATSSKDPLSSAPSSD